MEVESVLITMVCFCVGGVFTTGALSKNTGFIPKFGFEWNLLWTVKPSSDRRFITLKGWYFWIEADP